MKLAPLVALGLTALLTIAPAIADAANLTPHEATYSVTAGAGDRAPQIGTARQKLGDGCLRSSFERDVKVSLSLSQALRYDVSSVLRATENRNGRAFDYRLERAFSGEQSQRSGQLVLNANGGIARLSGPNGPKTVELPPGVLLPQAMIGAIIDRLARGETRFTLQAFDVELVSNVVELEVLRISASDVPSRPQDAALVGRVGAPAYPLIVNFVRGNGKPLFTARLLLHANGVISRLIASFGPFTVAANLTQFSPLPQLRCAPPIRAAD